MVSTITVKISRNELDNLPYAGEAEIKRLLAEKGLVKASGVICPVFAGEIESWHEAKDLALIFKQTIRLAWS